MLDYGAEIVVVATGSHWAGDGLNGLTQSPIPGADASMPHVLTPEQVMLEGKEAGERVLVFDTDGYFVAVGIAEKLVREGRRVTFPTPFQTMAPYTQLTLEASTEPDAAGARSAGGHRADADRDRPRPRDVGRELDGRGAPVGGRQRRPRHPATLPGHPLPRPRTRRRRPRGCRGSRVSTRSATATRPG